MFILRSSSPFRALWSQPRPAEVVVEAEEQVAVPLEEPTGEPFIDEGLPLPDAYAVDIVRAMIQDPFRIFIYWEVREQSLKALTLYFSAEDAAEFRPTLKLTEIAGRHDAFFEVGRHGRYWMMVFPDREYEFEMGVRSPKHGYIALVRSNRVRTPRGTVSPDPAPEPEYRLTPPQFLDVLEASGFAAGQLLDLTVAAIPSATGQNQQLPDIVANFPEPVRDAMVTAAMGGALKPEMIATLPEVLRSELLKLQDSDGRLASAGLMHYLPEMLREAIEDEREPSGEQDSAANIAPRVFFGSSENAPAPGDETRQPRQPQFRAPGSLFQTPGSGFQKRG